jgi:hypothetical protein
MAIRVIEATTCFRCEDFVMAEVGIVHPLCGECQKSFDEWFNAELKKFEVTT